MEAINYQEKPEVQALLFLNEQKPQLLDCVGLLMIALEDCNFHSELAKLQEITGIKVNQFYNTKWDKVGIQLSNKKGLGLLLAKSGITLSNYKL
jgi:hypothetical protein